MIYLDNAATTFPKPQSVIDTMCDFLKNSGGNPGRGGHFLSRKSAEEIFLCRENMARLINADNPENIIFTKNATEAINIAIKGICKTGDEIIISSMEHNSVLRSAVSLENKGITLKVARADVNGFVSMDAIIPLITDKTKLICLTHASNVVGTVNPIRDVCMYAREKGIYTLIDCAQTGGVLRIDSSYLDMAAFAGHKGLYGPFGTGVLYVRDGITLNTLIEGGTGSMSESAFMPEILPDKFEAGTLNACGIAGLNEGIKFVLHEGIYEKEAELTSILIENLSDIKGIKILGKPTVGVVGLVTKNHDCVDISSKLDSEFEIASRAGLHCAPMAHRTLGTITTGMLRLSLGYFNTKDDISAVSKALNTLLK